MQDKKLINFGGATVGAKGVYSIEFHEDDEFTHVKRANRDGTATYFSLANGSSPNGQTVHPFELWKNQGSQQITAGQAPGVAFYLDGSQGTNLVNTPAWMTDNLFKQGLLINTPELIVGQVVSVLYSFMIVPSSSNGVYIFHSNFLTDDGYIENVISYGDTGHAGIGRIVSGTYNFTVVDESTRTVGQEPSFACRTEHADAVFTPLFAILTVV